MKHKVSWWIQGGADLRTETGIDFIEYEGELYIEKAEEILEKSLEDFSTTFANEHYLIECGVWDFGVSDINPQPKDWAKEWDTQAKYIHTTGMSKSYLRREMICPDCGSRLSKHNCPQPDHFVYLCRDCPAMLKDKGNKTSWNCREW